MAGSHICRLCRNTCAETIHLRDENGDANEIYNIAKKFFHSMFLDAFVTPGSISREIAVLCLDCWNHICNFNNFQQTILVVQANLLKEMEQAKLAEIISEGKTSSHNSAINQGLIMHELSDNGGNGFGSGKLIVTDYGIEFSTDLDDIAQSSQTHFGDATTCQDMNISREEHNEFLNESEPSTSNPKSLNDSIIFKRDKVSSRRVDATIARWKPELECRLCSEKFPCFYEIRKHTQFHHPTEEFYIMCCGIKLKYRFRIEEHAILHMDPKAFTCKDCGKRFHTKLKFLNHMYKEVVPPRIVKDTCPKCGETFDYLGGLYCHKKIHHPEMFTNKQKKTKINSDN
ncbi:uncharacterized protein LOC142231710 isoform X2 [Haematobia irritans]|uniref:uncharacterized protein LOC142231710 isoform X2 n=1 Tax=Haematobia irritans TaxID=7368 RepID=UPI003F50C1CE